MITSGLSRKRWNQRENKQLKRDSVIRSEKDKYIEQESSEGGFTPETVMIASLVSF